MIFGKRVTRELNNKSHKNIETIKTTLLAESIQSKNLRLLDEWMLKESMLDKFELLTVLSIIL